jgi:hypothetical protein
VFIKGHNRKAERTRDEENTLVLAQLRMERGSIVLVDGQRKRGRERQREQNMNQSRKHENERERERERERQRNKENTLV